MVKRMQTSFFDDFLNYFINEDDFVIISFHFYPGQHVYMSTDSEERKTQLEDKISYFIQLREKTGMPLWVGETGGHFPKDKLTEGINLIKDCLDIYDKHGISWTLWTYKDAGAMGMVYPNENTKWMSIANDFRHQWQVKCFNKSNFLLLSGSIII